MFNYAIQCQIEELELLEQDLLLRIDGLEVEYEMAHPSRRAEVKVLIGRAQSTLITVRQSLRTYQYAN